MSRRVLVLHGLHAGERQPWGKVMDELRGRLEAGEYASGRQLLESLVPRDMAALTRALRRKDEALWRRYEKWWTDELRRRVVEATMRRFGGRAVD